MLDLSKVPVIVGFGEVGPWGSARTRWEWEVAGRFSRKVAIELARTMGLLQFWNGPVDKKFAGHPCVTPGTDYVG